MAEVQVEEKQTGVQAPEGMVPIPPPEEVKQEAPKPLTPEEATEYLRKLAGSTLMFFNIVNSAFIQLGYSRKDRKRMFEDFRDFGIVDGRLNEAMKALMTPLIAK